MVTPVLRKPLFVANWKMNKLQAEAKEFFEEFSRGFSAAADTKNNLVDAAIAAPFTCISTATKILGNTAGVIVGAQNVHWLDSGAHTGEISSPMLKELGAQFVIVGHSERRQFYGETNDGVSKRAQAALKHGLITIVCVGESKQEFEDGATKPVISKQLRESLYLILQASPASPAASLIIAYEPVWAIGTGLAATPDIVADIHAHIRNELCQLFKKSVVDTHILYGGSVSEDNIAQLLALKNVDGVLVGSASLSAKVFLKLIETAR